MTALNLSYSANDACDGIGDSVDLLKCSTPSGRRSASGGSIPTDFTDEEWELLKTKRESNVTSRSNTAVADALGINTGVF